MTTWPAIAAATAMIVVWATAPADVHGLRVIDGDTFEVMRTGERLRLRDWDTPELTLGDACQRPMAREAKRAAARLLRGAEVVTWANVGRGGYGRTLVVLVIDGRDIGASLEAEGLARPYVPGRTGKGWC